MLFIKEEIRDNDNTVIIHVDGTLNKDSLPVMKKVYAYYQFKGDRVIKLNLANLIRLSREGLDFLKQIKGKVLFEELPEFLRMRIYDSSNDEENI